MQQGAGQRELLPHPVRVGFDELIGLVVELEQAEESTRALARDRGVDLVQARHERQKLAARELRVQIGRLREIADTTLDLARLVEHVEAGDVCGATARPHQARQHADRGRLAGPVGAEETEDLPGTDLESDVASGDEFAVALAQADGLDNRRGGRGHGRQQLSRAVCRTRGSDWRNSPPPGNDDWEALRGSGAQGLRGSRAQGLRGSGAQGTLAASGSSVSAAMTSASRMAPNSAQASSHCRRPLRSRDIHAAQPHESGHPRGSALSYASR